MFLPALAWTMVSAEAQSADEAEPPWSDSSSDGAPGQSAT